MDQIHTIGGSVTDEWMEWKAGHPDVFGSSSTLTR
jgi:hypothetical protein